MNSKITLSTETDIELSEVTLNLSILEAHREDAEKFVISQNRFVKGKGKGMNTGKEEELQGKKLTDKLWESH